MHHSHKIEQSAFVNLGLHVKKMELLPASGSARRYFRLYTERGSILAAINPDIRENQTFLHFSEYFNSQGVPVPKIYGSDPSGEIYFLEDLGDQTLFDLLDEERDENWPDTRIRSLYFKALDYLFKMQVEAGKGLDYEWCYPRKIFDRQSMLWDLNYFKYYFLKLAYIPFDEQKLEDDFQRFCLLLEKASPDFFMFRDFQSRNILVYNEKVFFIDYQGGRKGPLQYDLASLIYDAKANLPDQFRMELLNYYLAKVNEAKIANSKQWLDSYWAFVLIRIMQAMGAYGYRGFYEKKQHFLKSVPYAAVNLKKVLYQFREKDQFSELSKVWDCIIEKFDISKEEETVSGSNLNIFIQSFSYMKGLPQDNSEHGGGFIFDCRALPNPGREEKYKLLTGKDHSVISFLSSKKEVNEFISHVFALVKQSIDQYLDRGFTHLSISFGCTGGRHRSVYCAELLSEMIKKQYAVGLFVKINHREQPQ